MGVEPDLQTIGEFRQPAGVGLGSIARPRLKFETMEKHVPTLETCQKLRRFGFPQETNFWYTGAGLQYRRFSDNREYAAPILNEILEQLLTETEMHKAEDDSYSFWGELKEGWSLDPTEAAALFWLELHDGSC